MVSDARYKVLGKFNLICLLLSIDEYSLPQSLTDYKMLSAVKRSKFIQTIQSLPYCCIAMCISNSNDADVPTTWLNSEVDNCDEHASC